MDDFLWRAGLGGLGLALTSAPLGCFVVWRRMAYFGETIAHAGLLGAALGIVMGVNLTLGIFIAALILAFGLKVIEQYSYLAKDTALGLLAHVVLAAGLIVASQFQSLQVDLMGLLFGDILAISMSDLYVIFVGFVLITGLVIYLWQDMLTISIDKELAKAEGVNVSRVEFLFSIAIAATVALSMKLVGLLLVTAMLIVPAAGAMNFSRTPEQMVMITAFLSAISVVGGLIGSVYFDVPTGPAIVVGMALLFLLSSLMKRR
ncbi:MAG: membrane protein [Rhodomicrobium sp.]|nr:MAG: membrane protein [Rhodomicrobium sp.]